MMPKKHWKLCIGHDYILIEHEKNWDGKYIQFLDKSKTEIIELSLKWGGKENGKDNSIHILWRNYNRR